MNAAPHSELHRIHSEIHRHSNETLRRIYRKKTTTIFSVCFTCIALRGSAISLCVRIKLRRTFISGSNPKINCSFIFIVTKLRFKSHKHFELFEIRTAYNRMENNWIRRLNLCILKTVFSILNN